MALRTFYPKRTAILLIGGERRWIKQEVSKAISEMPLNELRNARGLSQQMIAKPLHIQQLAIAKLEKRTDIYPP
jgi:DNA-binding XRE family transcriptional regulator